MIAPNWHVEAQPTTKAKSKAPNTIYLPTCLPVYLSLSICQSSTQYISLCQLRNMRDSRNSFCLVPLPKSRNDWHAWQAEVTNTHTLVRIYTIYIRTGMQNNLLSFDLFCYFYLMSSAPSRENRMKTDRSAECPRQALWMTDWTPLLWKKTLGVQLCNN